MSHAVPAARRPPLKQAGQGLGARTDGSAPVARSPWLGAARRGAAPSAVPVARRRRRTAACAPPATQPHDRTTHLAGTDPSATASTARDTRGATRPHGARPASRAHRAARGSVPPVARPARPTTACPMLAPPAHRLPRPRSLQPGHLPWPSGPGGAIHGPASRLRRARPGCDEAGRWFELGEAGRRAAPRGGRRRLSGPPDRARSTHRPTAHRRLPPHRARSDGGEPPHLFRRVRSSPTRGSRPVPSRSAPGRGRR